MAGQRRQPRGEGQESRGSLTNPFTLSEKDMKLCRYGNPGQEKPALVDSAGKLRDLSKIIRDIDPAALAPDALAKLAATKPDSLPLVEGSPRIGVPVAGVQKYIAIGLNYSDHAA